MGSLSGVPVRQVFSCTVLFLLLLPYAAAAELSRSVALIDMAVHTSAEQDPVTRWLGPAVPELLQAKMQLFGGVRVLERSRVRALVGKESDRADQSGQQEKYTLAVSKVIPYGKEIDRLGLSSGTDGPRLGPESFSIDTEGNVHVCDTVNSRIQIYSQDGEYLDMISLREGVVPNDVVIDTIGNVYVYDVLQGKLYQYSKKREFLGAITVDSKRWSARSEMRIVNDRIVMESSDQKNILIGKIVGGILVQPTESLQLNNLGSASSSGRTFTVALDRFEKGTVRVTSGEGSVIQSIQMPLDGIVSIEFLGEDQEGNFYLDSERSGKDGVILEVVKYSPEGKKLASLTIPENDYSVWGVKLLSIDKNGNVYQLLPAEEAAKLNIFRMK